MPNRKNKIRRVQNATIDPKVFERLANLISDGYEKPPANAFTIAQAVGSKLGNSDTRVAINLKNLEQDGKLTRKRFRVWDGVKYRSTVYYF